MRSTKRRVMQSRSAVTTFQTKKKTSTSDTPQRTSQCSGLLYIMDRTDTILGPDTEDCPDIIQGLPQTLLNNTSPLRQNTYLPHSSPNSTVRYHPMPSAQIGGQP
jgi:hypothetical protein